MATRNPCSLLTFAALSCLFQLERERTKSAEMASTSEHLASENSHLEEQTREQSEVIARLQTVAADNEKLSGELYAVREQLSASKQTSTVMLHGAMEEFHLERLSLEKVRFSFVIVCFG